MSPTSSPATSLAVTVAHAVSYLIAPLRSHYNATTVNKLQTTLEVGLTSLYSTTWSTDEPLRGSGRRCLSFSPKCLPPRPVYNACLNAGIEWSEWIMLLGGVEFDIFVDPGCVSIRPGTGVPGTMSRIFTVWSKELEAQAQLKAQFENFARIQQCKLENQIPGKSLTEILMEDDAADEEVIFSMIANEVRAPTWMTPLLEQFPIVPNPPSIPSRTSSRNSWSSSEFSESSEESLESFRSVTSASVSIVSNDSGLAVPDSRFDSLQNTVRAPKASRRERVRQARVFVDTSKVDVTPYDGGKTTVLTGGVMLGIPSAGATGASRKMARRN